MIAGIQIMICKKPNGPEMVAEEKLLDGEAQNIFLLKLFGGKSLTTIPDC